jgi:hypothetical protein
MRSINRTMLVAHCIRPHRPGRRLTAALLVLTVVLTAACTSGTESPSDGRPTAAGTADASTPASTTPAVTVEPSEAQPTSEEPNSVTTIRITVAGQPITAELADNPTAQDLASQLPLTLSIRDFNGVEKIASLPRPLTMAGVPAGADPDINDIGYYAPSDDLVLYYGDVGYFNGIVRIGRTSGQSMQLIEQQLDGTQIEIEQA